MSISLKQVRAFVTLAESRSYAEAADTLHLSQPALSIAIKTLETQLSGSLLKRTTRSFSLTPEGQAFLPVAKTLLQDWDDAIEQVKNQFLLKSGRVSIAVMPTFAATLLPGCLKVFQDRYPDIQLSLNDVIAEEAVDMVRTGKAEVGICFKPDILDDVVFEPLFVDTFVAVLPPNHALLNRPSLRFREVLDEAFLTLQSPSVVTKLIEAAASEKKLEIRSVMAAHQLATIGRMVTDGLGLSIVPSVCTQQMNEMGAQCRPLSDANISNEIGILIKKRQALSAAANTFLDVIKTELELR